MALAFTIVYSIIWAISVLGFILYVAGKAKSERVYKSKFSMAVTIVVSFISLWAIYAIIGWGTWTLFLCFYTPIANLFAIWLWSRNGFRYLSLDDYPTISIVISVLVGAITTYQLWSHV